MLLFKKSLLILLVLLGTSLVTNAEKLKLPEFEPAPDLPEFDGKPKKPKKPELPTFEQAPKLDVDRGTAMPAIKPLPVLPEIKQAPKKKDTSLKAGDAMPNVTLTDTAGDPVNLPRYTHGRHSLIIFYRGSWSPYCKQHLKDIKTIEGPLLGLGYRVIAISPDKPETMLETIQELKPGYVLLSDSSMTAAKGFGIALTVAADRLKIYKDHGVDLQKVSGYSHNELPKPAIFLVSPGGIIRYSYSNDDFKVRIKPDELLKQANAHFRPTF